MFFPTNAFNFRFYELFLTAHGSLVATHHVINSSSGTNFPQSQPLVKDCQFGVSPVNYSDPDDSDSSWYFKLRVSLSVMIR